MNSQTINQADGSALNTWNGDVGSATATNAPTFITSSNLNGSPGVRFDAVNDGMITTLSQASGAYSIFTVYAHNDTADTDGNFRRVLNGGANTSSQNWLIGPYEEQHRHYAGNGWVTNPGPAAGTTPALLTAVNTGASSTFFVNGVDETDDPSRIGFFGELALGTAGRFAEPADSDVGLVLAFDMALTDDQLAGVSFIIAENFDLDGFTATNDQIAQGQAILAGTSLVPEPASIALWSILGIALIGFAWRQRRAKNETSR